MSAIFHPKKNTNSKANEIIKPIVTPVTLVIILRTMGKSINPAKNIKGEKIPSNIYIKYLNFLFSEFDMIDIFKNTYLYEISKNRSH